MVRSLSENFDALRLSTLQSLSFSDCSPPESILLNFFEELLDSHAQFVDTSVLYQVVDLQVLCDYDAIFHCVVGLGVVINEGLSVCGSAQAHLGLNECLAGTHVPIFESWHQVDVIIG